MIDLDEYKRQADEGELCQRQVIALIEEARTLRELNEHATRERERMAGEIDRLSENGRTLSAMVRRAIKYAREDRMVTPGFTRLQRVLDQLERVTADEDPPRLGCQCHLEIGDSPCRVHGEDEDPPFVCPGCHAVGEERCLDGCIDHEIEAETRHAIESGDYSPVGWRSVGEDEDEDEDVIVAGMPLPFVQVGMIVRPDDCQNPLFCSDCTGLVCAMRDDDRDRANMVVTLLFRDGKRRDEWSDVLRRHWRLVRDFDPSRVYTGRWSRGGPTAEVAK